MIVTLDGQKIDGPVVSDCTLETLLDQVRKAYLGERLIVSVAIDGERLDEVALQEQLERPVDEGCQCDLESGNPGELVRDALCGLAQEFQSAGERQADLPERLSSGDVSSAVRDIGQFVQLWQTCHRALGQCSGLLGVDLTEWEHNGRPVRVWLEDLVSKLTELREALEAQDVVLLSDLVRYELLPLCDTWSGVLKDLAGQVPQG